MTKPESEVRIGKAKGRPMLTWVGKRPLSRVRAFPAQHVETFSLEAPPGALADCDWSDWPEQFHRGGLLFHGDNKDVLAYLLANGFRGKVKLIYIDPPFDSGADYVRKVQLRGAKGTTKVDGEEYTLGEQIQYEDIWANDNYLQFIYERLFLMRELLAPGGSLFLHCDPSKNHHLRMLLDEIFGEEGFQNEIIWSYRRWPSNATAFQAMHDTIYWYVRRGESPHVFHKEYEEASDSYLDRFGGKTQYLDVSGTRKITSEEDTKGMPRRDVWEISIVAGSKSERTAYPTQKPEALLARIIKCCSNPGDLVLDAFVGSGTTSTVSQRMGRRWIAADINKGAIQTTAKRVASVIAEQLESFSTGVQQDLVDEVDHLVTGCQSSFATWRVNDYDLQIQHNEAVQLACDHIGITRTRADGYFDGTLGNRLVKIIPFNHPLTPLDLEDLREEFKRRPEEERDVILVSLGLELSAKAWIEEYNRNRPINRIHLIELRTDRKYGGFIRHEPLTASVTVERKADKVIVTVNDVFSPSIVQRLNLEEGIFRAQIDDWRAVVDCIMIDTDYDGNVFNVKLSDIPARKQDYVEGRYELPAPRKGAAVAVKVIDMLGEETILTQQI